MKVAYLDASALVKLYKEESETEALSAALAAWDVWVSSELIAVEASCSARRLGRPDLLESANDVVELLELVPCTAGILHRAGEPFDRPLRALDAIHAATVFSLGDDVGVVFVYDADLAAAIETAGLAVSAPGE